MDGLVHIYRDSVVPELENQKGFRETHLFTDSSSGKGVMVTLWETEADMMAFEASGVFQQHLAKFHAVLGAPATRERYEVAV
jgi:heme-degrading monooxygenase HmoA